jgi:hypothetical protein
MKVNHRRPSATGHPHQPQELRDLQDSLLKLGAEHAIESRTLFRTALQMAMERTVAADALAELHDLLEWHAPAWYTLEQHERLESALRLLGRA